MTRYSRESPEPDPDVVSGEAALGWARERGAAERVIAHSRAKRRQRSRMRLAGISALAGLILIGGLWWTRSAATKPTALPTSVVVSEVNERILEDGTRVDLKPGAEITVDYSGEFRRVLLSRGEAHFSVAKNKARPFIVTAGRVEFRAVGTAFSVQLGAKDVQLLVTEGRVAVDQPVERDGSPMKASSLATVDAGNRVVVPIGRETSPVPVLAVTPAEVTEQLSWRGPKIELSGTKLSEALSVFNRYSAVRVSLADPKLGDLELSGVLRPDNPNALLNVVKVEFGLEAERHGDEIVLRRP